MSNSKKKNYNDLIKEVQLLLKQADAIKGEKLEIFFNEFQKEFKKKAFQERLISCDDAVLKHIAQNIIVNFSELAEKANSEMQVSIQTTVSAETATHPIATNQVQQGATN